MSADYDYFMVFEVDDSGERVKLDISEEDFTANNGQNFLYPEQVLVIVKEDIRRIYIWKGSKSPVRKRFISSRIASALQEELIKNAAFHRCKIVSIDQGDELREFLDAFRFKSMEVTEKLADMRYIRNIDREKMYNAGIIPDESLKIVKVEKKTPEHVSSALQELQKTHNKKVAKTSSKVLTKPKIITPTRKYSYYPANSKISMTSNVSLTYSEEEKIKEKILKTELPDNCKRENLILGYKLYGAVNKKVNVLGKMIEETKWEIVKTLPKEKIEIDNRKIRVYFNDERGIVEAIEILKKSEKKNQVALINQPISSQIPAKKNKIEIDYKTCTVKDLKKFAAEQEIKLPTKARKAEIIKIIKDTLKNRKKEKEPKTLERRKLPPIPNSKI
ncbi:MAG: hypothetical protein ACFFAN_18270 [Promethearchaeota archaeon]